MSKTLFVMGEGPGAGLPESYVSLGDDVLTLIRRLVTKAECPRAWMLVGDLYGDAVFDAAAAGELAEECGRIAVTAPSLAAAWLGIIAALARGASESGLYLAASAD